MLRGSPNPIVNNWKTLKSINEELVPLWTLDLSEKRFSSTLSPLLWVFAAWQIRGLNWICELDAVSSGCDLLSNAWAQLSSRLLISCCCKLEQLELNERTSLSAEVFVSLMWLLQFMKGTHPANASKMHPWRYGRMLLPYCDSRAIPCSQIMQKAFTYIMNKYT